MIRNGLLTALALLASFATFAQSSSYRDRAAAYIEQYKTLAIAEQLRSGIPAAVTLGQGILETEAGKSELATIAHNHFGIKCRKEWAGETFAHDDDAPQECFRKYSNAAQSYKDHSDYLRSAKRYAPCFALDKNDYAAWARQLRNCGYATNPKYAQMLTKIIEDFHLQDYTNAALGAASGAPVLIASAESPAAAVLMIEDKKGAPGEVVPEHDTPDASREYGKLIKKDGTRGFWAHKGDVLLEYAIQYKVHYAKILELNGLPDAPLASDQFVYIERGGKVDAMLAKDYSEPVAAAPATAAVVPVAPPSQAVAKIEEQPRSAAKTEETPPANISTSAPAAPEVSAGRDLGSLPAQPIAANSDIAKPAETEAPMDEFSRLKAKLDRAVYAPEPPRAAPKASPAPVSAKTPVVAASAASGNEFHTVQAGETMFGIAKHAGISMKELMELNGLKNFEAIKVGQKLRVK